MSSEPHRIREAIQQFLAFFAEPPGERWSDLGALAVWLDRLALLGTTLHVDSLPGGTDSDLRNLPADPSKQRGTAKQLADRFGDTVYWFVFKPLQEDDQPPAPTMASLADDLYDIRNDLERVLAVWQHFGEQDALWEFYIGYTTHWGRHLRQAQSAIHAVIYG